MDNKTETVSDNELIAEFLMGPLKDGEHWEDLQFHTSWDELMPVVEKITKMHSENFHYDPSQIAQDNWPPDNEYMEVIALPLYA